jgi:hypothetical protein
LKKTKIIIAVVSVVVVASLVASLALTLNQIWNAIYDIQEELEIRAITYVIEGSFDVTQDGDVVEVMPDTEYHWKRIPVPQLTLEDMPNIQVYVKINDRDKYAPLDTWKDVYATHGIMPGSSVVYDEQSVLVLYKRFITDLGTDYFFNGEYKVTVTK